MPHTLYFISHPEVEIRADVPVPEWSLSATGLQRMHKALSLPWINTISAVYSSCEKKAMDGATVLSEHLALPYHCHSALGENDRSSTGFLEPARFEDMANAFFANPTESVLGWERAIDAQTRIADAVKKIDLDDKSEGSIAIISHGAVGTLLYCHMTNTAINRKYDQPGKGGGNFMELQFSPSRHCTWWSSIT